MTAVDAEKRIPEGGTSAGMHSMGKLLHAPGGTTGSIISKQALDDPYVTIDEGIDVTLENHDNFFEIPMMENIITDTHWSERNRMGRSIVILARVIKDGMRTQSDIRLIACDEYTTVCFSEDGIAKIFGYYLDDNAFFIKINSADSFTCDNDTHLEWSNNEGNGPIEIHRVLGTQQGNNTFNINTWNGGEVFYINVTDGKIDSTEPNIQTPWLESPYYEYFWDSSKNYW